MTKLGYRISVSHVSRIFNGERDATSEFLETLAKVLGMTKTQAKALVEDIRAANKAYRKMPEMVVEYER
jgi:transcriptional regulator with XRE-family HTH domain